MTATERAVSRRLRLLFGLVLCACAGLPAVPRASGPAQVNAPQVEWPAQWDGRPLRPLAPSAVEARFSRGFPGRIARLTDGEKVLVWRHVEEPTRMLHPAADCFRSLGYRIAAARLEHDPQQRLWRCFEAERPGRRWRVCERIVDADGRAFTDASSWFWSAQLGRSAGPWQAITTATPL